MLSSDVLLDLGRQRRLIEQIGSSLTVDEDLDLFELATQMQSVTPADITFQTIPGLTDVREDVGLVLLPPSPPVLHDFFASLGGTPEPPEEPSAEPVDPGDVVVDVFNGSGVSGAAAAAAEALGGAGFVAGNGGNADEAADLTTIRHAPGDEARAAALLAQVPGAAVTVDDSLPDGTVHLVLGADFNGVGQAVTAPPAEEPGGYDTRERTAEDTSCIA